MTKNFLELLIKKIQLQILILKIQLQIKLLKQRRTIPNLRKPRYIVIHHSGNNHSFWQINEYHKQRWGFLSSLNYYIGYHKFIAYDGRLYIARRDNEEGAHCVEKGNPRWWNRNSVGICLQGNFEKERLTDFQLEALKKELDKYNVPIRGHREISVTLCPGRYLWEWLTKYR